MFYVSAQEMLPTAQIRINNNNNGFITAGEDVVLLCNSESTTTSATWNRNNRAVVPSTGFAFATNGELDNGKLTVRDFSERQAGNYTCVVSNHLGAVSSATVTLQLAGQCNYMIITTLSQ